MTARSRHATEGFEAVVEVARTLPGVKKGTSYGTPALRVRGALFARLHQDGESLVVRTTADARDALLRANPKAFYVTEHYRNHPWVLIRLDAISSSDLREVVEEAWRLRAPASLRKRVDES